MNTYEYRQTPLSVNVMRRIWVVYTVRRAINSEIVKGAVFGACCVTAVFLVSVPSIIQNVVALEGAVESAAYLMGAFLEASIIVEVVVVVAVGVGGLLFWDISRNVGSASYSFFVRGKSRV